MRARWAQPPYPVMESGTLCQLLQQIFLCMDEEEESEEKVEKNK